MSNQAAWIPEAKAKLEVAVAPEATAGPGEVVIKTAAVAVNPLDAKIQATGAFIKQYPMPQVLGADTAGEIVQVGEGVTRFKEGDRVLANCIGLLTTKTKHAGFQLYTVVPEIMVAPIPDSMPFENAAVLPLSLSTAAAGLYQKDYLALPYPTKDPKPTKQTILIWGGSSSVGASAIQLAVASGITVATTASGRNHDYVKSLGAKLVFDYCSPDVVEDLVKALKETALVGVYDCISEEKTVKTCGDVLHQLGGGMIVTTRGKVGAPVGKGLPQDVKVQGVFALDIASQEKEVAEAVYKNYVPEALQDGRLQAKPDPLVIEGGLDKMQAGFDRVLKGVSAKKVVVGM
ncbi:MAG: hypothetical protein M1827_006306 [Pycnora praestabilis]|nr:MAG: hypothetical protein M1827_006306 [Pycnora praestabilis]